MRTRLIIAATVVAAAAAACSDNQPSVSDPAGAICQELSGSWDALLADESPETARRIGQALAASNDSQLKAAADLYLQAAEYPRDAEGNITLDAAREHIDDYFAMVKAVAAGCTAIGIELSQAMREAAESAELMDGDPTDEESSAHPPVTVAIGQKARMEGDDGAIEVTVGEPSRHTSSPSGEQPEFDTFLVVDVTMLGVGGSYLYSSLSSFTLVGADGTQYYPGYFPSFGAEIDDGLIGAGESAQGTIVFDVPAAAIDGGKILLEGFGVDFTQLPGAVWTL